MPIIRIDYDKNAVSENEVTVLSEYAQQMVVEKTGIPEVMVYVNKPHIQVKVFPIEVFIEMSADKIKDRKQLVGEIRDNLKSWKEKAGFKHLINLTLIPMDWDMEFDI